MLRDDDQLPILATSNCGQCLFEAGHLSGMAGAARCAILERPAGGGVPDEWSRGTGGRWVCASFVAAFESDEPEPEAVEAWAMA